MKDEYKRRRDAERHLIKTLPDGDPNIILKPIRQELIGADCNEVTNVCTQGNEFIVTSTDKWWVEVYILESKPSKLPLNTDSISEISDDELVPQHETRKSVWCAIPRKTTAQYGDVTFVAPDLVGFVVPGTPASVCTFYVRTGECVSNVSIPGAHFQLYVTKICDTEFVVASNNGNLYFFSHERGNNLQATSRIWKAHVSSILSVLYHKGIVVSASTDWTVRLWDLKSKKRVAILSHDQEVEDVAISDDFIVTCSRYGRTILKKGEVRIYKNSDGYQLLKILRHTHFMGSVKIVDNKRVICRRFAFRNHEFAMLESDFIMVIDIERECEVVLLKVGSRHMNARAILADGRLVVVGGGGCRAVIATFPRRVRELICDKGIRGGPERRILCSLM